MAKFFALLAVALATLALVDAAQARGRRGGCHGGSCYVGGGGCAGGSCYVGGEYKSAATIDAAAPVVEVAPSASNVVVSAPPAPRYSNNVRRGWFARRR